ncbi:phosphoribosylamine--glycine ligase [Desulfacinum hydrothermale DSM 13146]|uniref:Phosphoribosylamine--glycine ligase n=1 Tax=Desulfacinum hydrothermale DSM 13146 TaxID=1121390 RepID=A0A1W1XI74_9BACT|nr:phosphoribosylamine--glycine ligase [Desulfacinum hydrothermale]SMC23482.1 phosphoribosylamine--glycine ligase [Desulfacinum hydrothermale DSM 13146]
MKVLVVGSGGRDHAIAWKFTQSDRVRKVYVAHGNAGISQTAECVDARTPEQMAAFAEKEGIDLTFVGPESPLSAGIVDLFESRGLSIVGPNQRASRLESSKCDTKVMLRELGIPIPEFQVFSDPHKARDYVRSVGYPVVVKADGLAAGKGSLVCDDVADAEEAIHQIMEKRIFGEAGARVDIEKRLYGRELSFFCFSDGYTLVPMVAAQDYKRARDNDEGKNTGGMGSYSPHPWLDDALVKTIMERVAEPLIQGLRETYHILYRGILYLGLMLVEEADGIMPYVLEINIRLGDPEAQVILPRLQTDLVEVSEAILTGRLKEMELQWDPRYRLCLIAVSGRTKGKKGWYKGYPERYKIGVPIRGLDAVDPSCLVFHSGTGWGQDGELVTTGGRVLCIVSTGESLSEAREIAYREMAKVSFQGMYYRSDIGKE